MVRINLRVRMIDFDLYFVEDTFGAHEEVSSCRIATPDYSGGTINLNAEMTRIHEPIQHGQIARQDGIFGVFEVGVFHSFRIPGFGGSGRFGGQLGNCHTIVPRLKIVHNLKTIIRCLAHLFVRISPQNSTYLKRFASLRLIERILTKIYKIWIILQISGNLIPIFSIKNVKHFR